MPDFLKIKNQTDLAADIYFYGDIVSSEWGKWEDTDTCPEDVRAFLKQVEGVKNLNIYVNSGGGSVFAGLAIYNMLKRNSAHKTVYVDGLAGSIASVIAMAGDKIVIPSNAFLMIHKPWSMSMGNSNDLRKMADDLDLIEEGILNVYSENIKDGVDMEEIKQMVNDETWLNGKEASKYFNIDVAEENKLVACTSEYFKNYEKLPKQLREQTNQTKQDENTKEKMLIELTII
ncbi:Clp protease ClpP [Bacillus sp. seq1]|uniref:head maturation protease, ClpP-related n=1 Tax=Bacillus TaxID=1386 RepID=UPI00148FA3BC|nr:MULTISPECIES: head maturation protease, ClpP-related [Bacillus]MBE0185461.1 Clp protease ClpP [Bacillus subtilis]MCC2526764.1 Clp protease ClpP [Bacillus halotolerans]NOV05429.1 Clp protease ClpP [Bacillus sp. seq1]